MSGIKKTLLVALALGLAGQAVAQNLDMEGTAASATFDAPGKPTRGMTQERVLADYGDPSRTTDAVGDPPISRWEYAGFVVFFEYDRVIHAVSKR